jgi:hypothetical protein
MGNMTDADFKKQLSAATLPDYKSILDPNGQIQSPYKVNAGDIFGGSHLDQLMQQLQGINYNTSGIDALRARATGTGQSPWATMMLEKQGLDQGNAMDAATKAGNVGLSKAYSGLASHGGLSSGAALNLARKGMRDTAGSRMAVGRQGMTDRLGILTQDEATKNDLLKGLPGAEATALAPSLQKANMWASMADTEAGRQQQANTAAVSANQTAALKDKGASDDWLMQKYQEQMKAWGADRTATAQENSGKK